MILFYLTVLRFTKECDSSFVLPASKCSVGVVFVIVLFEDTQQTGICIVSEGVQYIVFQRYTDSWDSILSFLEIYNWR